MIDSNSVYARKQPKSINFSPSQKIHTQTFSASAAQDALAGALRTINLSYSPIGAWLGEIVDQVVVPTVTDLRKAHGEATSTAAWLIVGGLAAFVLIARATAPAADAYARLYQNFRRSE
jgi:hypothetical protein